MDITKDKVTELFCIIDEFYKVFDAENAVNVFVSWSVGIIFNEKKGRHCFYKRAT